MSVFLVCACQPSGTAGHVDEPPSPDSALADGTAENTEEELRRLAVEIMRTQSTAPDRVLFEHVHIGRDTIICGRVNFPVDGQNYEGFREFVVDPDYGPDLAPRPDLLAKLLDAPQSDLSAQRALLELVDQQIFFADRYAGACAFPSEQAGK